jgi:2-polyprenyl-6-methoxyphenol hydroxylase-like FAD-dependent oxidoreductase
VISRHKSTANTPRARILNQRAMEVLRDAGLDQVVKPYASNAHHMMHSSWLHSLAGEEYGRLWAWGNKPSRLGEYAIASPCEMSDLPQSRLEPILVESATKAGAEYRFYTEFVSQESSTDGGIQTTLKDRNTGQSYQVRSDYLLGADGARSSVLDSLGIVIDGKQLNTAFNVHIKADLSKYIAHRPGSLNWILNPEVPNWSAVGNFRMVTPWNEFVVSMHPAEKPSSLATKI